MAGKRPEHRYYLLPGQGRGARKKSRRNLKAAIIVGIVFGGVLSSVIWLMNQYRF